MWEVIVPAVGNLIGGLLGSNAAEKQRKEELELQKKVWEREHYYKIRDTVADAKAAGLHPLFALGTGMSAGGGAFIPGQSATGSFADVNSAAAFGEWMGNTSSAVGDYLAGQESKKAQGELDALQALHLLTNIEETRSRTALNQAEAARASSEAMTSRQSLLSTPGGQLNMLVSSALAQQGKAVHKGALGSMPVLPGQTMAQDAEDWGGELGGILVGARNVVESTGRSWWESLKDVMGPPGRRDAAAWGLQKGLAEILRSLRNVTQGGF